MMNEKKHGIGHNIRQAVLVTVVLLVLCGLVFPVLLSGLSAVIFPSQAKGSLVTADGIAVGQERGSGLHRGLLYVVPSLRVQLQYLL